MLCLVVYTCFAYYCISAVLHDSSLVLLQRSAIINKDYYYYYTYVIWNSDNIIYQLIR